MKFKKKLRGYIFSRPFMGERVPQHVQNIIIRNYCSENEYQYLLSSTEYVFKNSDLMLKQVIHELNQIDGVVSYSLYQLPEDTESRQEIYKKIIKKKKEFHFALEGLKITNKFEVEKIEKLWLIKKILPYCPKTLDIKK